MFGLDRYNYRSFTRELIEQHLMDTKSGAGGPRPGELAPDFRAQTLDGERVRLSEFRGQRSVVLTFGSLTCPMTSGSMRGLSQLHEEYGDQVQFLFVYVREAHPGDEIPAHRTQQEKEIAAEVFREEEEVEIPIIVDDLRGSIHRKYGKLPNPTYIIDMSGRVAFRSLWTRTSELAAAIQELLAAQEERGLDHAVVHGGEDLRIPMAHRLLYAHHAIERGGPQALADFRQVMGVPGRVALMAGRVGRPMAEHPTAALSSLIATAGVLAGAIYLGQHLRERRMATRPYQTYRYSEPERKIGPEDYAVGI